MRGAELVVVRAAVQLVATGVASLPLETTRAPAHSEIPVALACSQAFGLEWSGRGFEGAVN